MLVGIHRVSGVINRYQTVFSSRVIALLPEHSGKLAKLMFNVGSLVLGRPVAVVVLPA